jgi:hypothetical protein
MNRTELVETHHYSQAVSLRVFYCGYVLKILKPEVLSFQVDSISSGCAPRTFCFRHRLYTGLSRCMKCPLFWLYDGTMLNVDVI